MPTLKELLVRPLDHAPVITITGEQGVGKTTLGCLFPKPVVLRFEDGLQAIPAKKRPFAFPLATSQQQAMAYIDKLIIDDHPFRTLVVDSVSRFATIIESEIIASDPRKPKSINQALGGYGAGLNACAERHRMFAEKCNELLIKRDMALVYIAHSTVRTIEPPDADPYTRYTLRLDERATNCYIDAADMVCFVRIHTKYVTKEDSPRARAITGKDRVIIVHPTGAHVSKNRYDIQEPVAWADKTVNPLLPLIPYYATTK